ncbi:MAG: acyl-CoA thioesterase [Bacillota bacterium]
MVDNDLTFHCSVRVRYGETDQMGIAYHANYLAWFDVARTEYLRSLGPDYRQVEEMGLLLPVVEASCRYLAPARYDDLLQIRVELLALGAATLCFRYQVLRADDGQLLASGQTRQAFVSKDLRPLNCKRRFPEFWQLLQQHLVGSSDHRK